MTDTQAADLNQALAVLLEAYDLLGAIVLTPPPAPAKGWNTPQQISDIYDRIWFAIEKVGALEPQRLALDKRLRLQQRPTDAPRRLPAGWLRL